MGKLANVQPAFHDPTTRPSVIAAALRRKGIEHIPAELGRKTLLLVRGTVKNLLSDTMSTEKTKVPTHRNEGRSKKESRARRHRSDEIWHNHPIIATMDYSAEETIRPELMDGPGLPLAATERALADLDRVNQRLLGFGASLRTLLPRIAAGPSQQLLIDLGTGSGRVSRTLTRAAARLGVDLEVIGVDRKLCHLLYGRDQGNGRFLVVAAAAALPFRDASAHWSFSNLFFHHFTAGRNRSILHEMRRVASCAAVVVDLRRALCARLLARLLLPLLGVGRVARYDGMLSTDQAWCLEDVARMTAEEPVLELRRRFPFRFSLVLGGRIDALPTAR